MLFRIYPFKVDVLQKVLTNSDIGFQVELHTYFPEALRVEKYGDTWDIGMEWPREGYSTRYMEASSIIHINIEATDICDSLICWGGK